MSGIGGGRADDDAPEQTYFADPAMDRLMGVVFNLAAELQVVRDRLTVAECLLERHGLLQRAEIDGFEPTAAEQAMLADDRRDYVRHMLEPIMGRAASRSPE